MRFFRFLVWTKLFVDVEFVCNDCSIQGIGVVAKFDKIRCPNCKKELVNLVK